MKYMKHDDLLNIKKINFYYIFFKYVLKNQIYINQIPFLLKIKKRILTFIKFNYNISSIINKINEPIRKEKIEFVLKFFLDLYYYKQYTTTRKTTSSIFMQINDEENEDDNPLFKNLGKDEWVKILNNSTFTLKIGNKSTCKYIDIEYGNNNVKISYNYFKKIAENEKYKKQKYFNDFIKFSKFLEEIKSLFNKTFEKYPNFNLVIKLKFETTFYSGSTTNIQCNYIYSFREEVPPNIITDYNILYMQNYNRFNTLIREISRFLDNQIQRNDDEELHYQLQEEINEFYDEYNEFVDNIQNNI